MHTTHFNGGAPAFVNDYRSVQTALGDLQASGVVLRRVYPRISEVVQSVVGSSHNLDDITQLAAVEVFRCLDRYHGRGSIEAWAAKIAYRKAVRVLKREWKKKKVVIPLEDRDFEDGNTPNPEESMSREQLLNLFLSKIRDIPLKRRMPLILHLVHGYTIREVSELTKASVNTTKDRLKTATRELRIIVESHPNLVTAMLEESQ